jgi:hypothetical protein
LLNYLYIINDNDVENDGGFIFRVLSILIIPALLPFVIPICLKGFSFKPNMNAKAISFSDLELEEGADLQMDSLGDLRPALSRNDGAFIIGDNEIEEINPFDDLNALHGIKSQETICTDDLNMSAHFVEVETATREPVDVVDTIPSDWVRFDERGEDMQTYAPITLTNPFKN